MGPNSRPLLVITIFPIAASIACFAQDIIEGSVTCAIVAAPNLLARARRGKGR